MEERIDLTPKVHYLYRHFKNGDTYIVLAIATNESSREQQIVYVSTTTNEVWVRSLDSWESVVQYRQDNKTGQRYRFELAEIGGKDLV